MVPDRDIDATPTGDHDTVGHLPEPLLGACLSSGGATWLQVDDVAAPGDTRPVVTETLGPTWGYHADDINLASGNLVRDVQLQEKAYAAARH